MVSRDDVFIMFMRKDVYKDDVPALKGTPLGASETLCYEVDNVGDLYNSFMRNEVDITKDIFTTWYGMKEFYIRDCNGYILGVAQQAQQS